MHVPNSIFQVRLLLSSYHHWTGKDLIDAGLSSEAQVKALWQAPFVLVSHDTQSDPILNYGNRQALLLWEMDWDEFVTTPSRLTAENLSREARQLALQTVAQQGYLAGYTGVRISKSGRRFKIEDALIFNLIDVEGDYWGQAATFSKWTYLS